MTALDDLDAALARMQGDDSGGPLGPALDAARRVRSERRELTDAEAMVGFAARITQRITADAAATERERRISERRVRREVRALTYPLAAVAVVVSTTHVTSTVAVWGWALLTALLLVLWCAKRPTLPGDTTPQQWIASARSHPLLWSVTVALAVGTGISFGMAIPLRGDDPAGTFWLIAAVLLLVVTGGWFSFVVSLTRPTRPPRRETKS